MADRRQIADLLTEATSRAPGGARQLAQTYLGVLFDPGRAIAKTTVGVNWLFPLVVIVGNDLVWAALLRLSWPTAARLVAADGAFQGLRPNVALIVLAGLVFCVVLAVAAMAGVRVFAGQRPNLLTLFNCVAVGLVPFSALTIAAWIVLYLSPGLAVLVLIFAALAAVGFFAEALRSQYDLTIGCTLYAVPLMVVVALLTTVLLLLVLGSRQPAV
jgi:hypothetical protein